MKRLLPWFPSLLWMSAIFYLSGRTGGQLKSMFPFLNDFDWGHFLAYFILSALYYYALAKTTSLKKIPFWAVFLCLLYGITDEYHQSFVPSRTPDIWDLFHDVIGATLAAVAVTLHQKKQRKRMEDVNKKTIHKTCPCGQNTITRVRNGRAQTVTGSQGSVIVGQRLVSGRNGSVSAGGQTGGCSGRLCSSPNDCCRVTRDIHWSS